jgi:glutaminyl-peptide cyclotransferase
MQTSVPRAALWLFVPLLALACQGTLACDNGKAATTSTAFDAERAWSLLEGQVALGPRPSGSAEIEACRKAIEADLTASGLTPKRETWKETTPVGEIEFTNVWTQVPGSDAEKGTIVLGTHFDTKRMPFPFVGANDGGSGTAVLLEIARVLARQKSAFTYRIVFFDGEEATLPEWHGKDNTYGSRHHAQAMQRAGEAPKTRAFVLLDMVGDKDLVLERESLSDGKFLDCFVRAARDNGLGAHVGGRSMEISDDHDAFMAINVRSVDLIDFDYGPNNSFWHTKDDTLANCSKQSLEAIGKITLLGLRELEKQLGGS